MTIYDIAFLGFSLVYLPCLLIKGKRDKDFKQRFGVLPEELKTIGKEHPIWIHAVSVGEVLAVRNFVKCLKERMPGKRIILSTTTRTGNDIAKRSFNKSISIFYFPLDISFIIRRVLDIIQPSALLIMETEIWPNLIEELSKRRIPAIIINGRISDKSYGGYKKISFFFKKILQKITLFCMQTKEDGEKIKGIGAPEASIKVTGNMKFDVDSDMLSSGKAKVFSKADLGLNEGELLFVAGSTHAGEDEKVLDVYTRLLKRFGNLRLLIAPRHPERSSAIARLIREEGFREVLFSAIKKNTKKRDRKEDVILLDTLGDLNGIFSISDIVFMGGSLVKKGGHNLVEPAFFAKPIVFGRNMSNFKSMARSFLSGNAALQVQDEEGLFGVVSSLLEKKEERIALGKRAKALIDTARGATKRNVEEVANLVEG